MQANNTQKVIKIGFLSFLLLVSALTIFSIHRLQLDHSHLKEASHNYDSLQHLFIMRDATARRALILYRMSAINDPFVRDELFLEYKEQAEIFIKSRLILTKRNQQSQSLNQYKNIQPLLKRANNMHDETIQLLLDEKFEEADQLLQNDMLQIQNKVTAGLTVIVDRLRLQMDKTIDIAYQKNNQTTFLISILGIFVFILGSIIAIFVLRYAKVFEAAILKQKEAAEDASRCKSTFLANMSHEIRTPLTAIIGYSENIITDDTLTREARIKTSQTILRNGKHLHQLINNVLDISKIEAAELVIESVETSPIDIIEELKSIIGPQATNKNLKFNIHYHFPLPENFHSDPVRLKQILINLCSNAIKFTEQGSIDINIHYNEPTRSLTFLIQDTGIGMTEQASNTIFSAFTQAESSTTRKYGGTGLGLTISKQLAEAMNGTLTCSSTLGEGSVFKLELELEPTADIKLISQYTANTEESNETNNDNIPSLQGKILLAEDNPDNQELISMYIEKTGAELTIVENGEQAVEEGIANNYQLILMDMQMPVMDGVTAIEFLRATGYTRAIVSLTANALQSDKDKCLKAGADDYLVKPIDLKRFYHVLQQYLQPRSDNDKTTDTGQLQNKMKKLAEKFLQTLPEKLNLITEAYKNKDWKMLEGASHKLKGLGGAFGYPKITDLAQIVNDLTRENKYSELDKAVNDLQTLCNNVLNNNAV